MLSLDSEIDPFSAKGSDTYDVYHLSFVVSIDFLQQKLLYLAKVGTLRHPTWTSNKVAPKKQ